jgi:hypothetical protein
MLPDSLANLTSVKIADLREKHPQFTWSAERGTRTYVGVLGERRVEVQAFSKLVGPGDDDFMTEWRVRDGTDWFDETFSAWSWRLRTAPKHPIPEGWVLHKCKRTGMVEATCAQFGAVMTLDAEGLRIAYNEGRHPITVDVAAVLAVLEAAGVLR